MGKNITRGAISLGVLVGVVGAFGVGFVSAAAKTQRVSLAAPMVIGATVGAKSEGSWKPVCIEVDEKSIELRAVWKARDDGQCFQEDRPKE